MQVPETIAIKLLNLFSTDDSVNEQQLYLEVRFEQINLKDIEALYVVFKKGKAEELGEIAYEMIKQLTRDEIFKL